MLKCRDVARLADSYVDGDLSRWQRLSMRLHLLMCGHCRNYVDSVAKTVSLLRSLSSPDSPEDGACTTEARPH